ncbi:MAG: hypothetical protein JWN04_6800 [Myxococcaceae bacterium]|nr:hypothetical protein [Myxococcaceae bacterium]
MPTQIEVPPGSLSEEAVNGLVDEFITREGTDYGAREHSLDEKRQSVLRQLARNEIAIVFDFESESTTLVSRDDLKKLGHTDESFLDEPLDP